MRRLVALVVEVADHVEVVAGRGEQELAPDLGEQRHDAIVVAGARRLAELRLDGAEGGRLERSATTAAVAAGASVQPRVERVRRLVPWVDAGGHARPQRRRQRA